MLSDLDQVISLVWASALPEQKEKDKGVWMRSALTADVSDQSHTILCELGDLSVLSIDFGSGLEIRDKSLFLMLLR